MPRHGLEPSGLKPIASASFMMTERIGIDRSAATGVAWSAANQFRTSRRSMSADRASGEARQELVPEITPVYLEGARLPAPPVSFEHGLGDRLEQGSRRAWGARARRAGSRPAYRRRASVLSLTFQFIGVAEDLPDALAAVLAVDEEALAARGQHPDAEALQLAVANIVRGLAGLQRRDSGIG